MVQSTPWNSKQPYKRHGKRGEKKEKTEEEALKPGENIEAKDRLRCENRICILLTFQTISRRTLGQFNTNLSQVSRLSCCIFFSQLVIFLPISSCANIGFIPLQKRDKRKTGIEAVNLFPWKIFCSERDSKQVVRNGAHLNHNPFSFEILPKRMHQVLQIKFGNSKIFKALEGAPPKHPLFKQERFVKSY